MSSGDAVGEATHLFVYGTLRPGEVRWHHLEPYVVADVPAVDTAVAGDLYDTDLDYPAAMFGGQSRILGRVYQLRADRLVEGLAHLDEVEGAVRGLYRRVVLTTGNGVRVFAYEGGDGLSLTPIASGDWLAR